MAKIIPSVIHGLLIKFLTVFLEQQVCMSHLGILILVKESRVLEQKGGQMKLRGGQMKFRLSINHATCITSVVYIYIQLNFNKTTKN